jgi:diketogulonate reductase-like aldo/keto reductase
MNPNNDRVYFDPSVEPIDPATVRQLKLPTGRMMPVAAFGTFHSDWAQAYMKDATVEAIRIGWRHLDTARAYENEDVVGEAIREAIRKGYIKSKDELFITGKLWNGHMKPKDVAPALDNTLKALGLEKIDLYLNHWPWPNVHPPGCKGDQRNPHAVPYIHEQFMETWGELVKLKKAGKIVHLGTSNHTELTMRLLLRDVGRDERPVVNQMEMHPLFQQTELRRYFESEGIICTGYMALGSPFRPARDTFKEHRADMQDPVILKIAAELGVSPARVCLSWAVQRMNHSGGFVAMATRSDHMRDNLSAATTDLLSAEQLARIDAIDANNRLIWGQVFLWPEAEGDWRVLWNDSQVFEKTADYLRFKKAFAKYMAVKQQTTVRNVGA